MLKTKVNHIGMAVPNIQDFLEKNHVLYAAFSKGPLISNDTQGVREMFITDGTTVIELLEPTSDTSRITGFLKRNRFGGLIHVGLDVEDLERAIRSVEAS